MSGETIQLVDANANLSKAALNPNIGILKNALVYALQSAALKDGHQVKNLAHASPFSLMI